MSINYKKSLINRFTYKPKNVLKHKHNYSIKCILEITNKNIHASCNYYNKKEYYEVLKCSECESFIPNSTPENFSGNIYFFNDNENNILIKASTNKKCPEYSFYDLFDVSIKK